MKKMNTLTIGDNTWAVGCPQINHESNEATIEPNVWNSFGEVSTLNVTKGDDITGIVNIYMVQFTVVAPESGDPQINFLNFGELQWYGGYTPTWQVGSTYEIGIIDGSAVCSIFKTP